MVFHPTEEDHVMFDKVKAVWSWVVWPFQVLWSAVKAIASATTWPARWALAKITATKFGLWVWAQKIDPPKMPLVYVVLFVAALPIVGAALDRHFVRGNLIQKTIDLESRLQALGQMNIACTAEKTAWQSRAMAAETKYEELVKRDPPSPGSPAALKVEPVKKAAPARRKKAPVKPWYDQIFQ
jgi:hypothetical protein